MGIVEEVAKSGVVRIIDKTKIGIHTVGDALKYSFLPASDSPLQKIFSTFIISGNPAALSVYFFHSFSDRFLR